MAAFFFRVLDLLPLTKMQAPYDCLKGVRLWQVESCSVSQLHYELMIFWKKKNLMSMQLFFEHIVF